MEKLTRQEAFALSLDVYYGRSSKEEYTPQERAEGFKNYLKDLNKNYRANKYEIFQILEDTINEILPKKVKEYVRTFAEFKEFDNNTTVKFRVKNGKIKAVAVALGGTVRRTRVDQGSFEVKTEAIQAKIYEEYERVNGGLVDWAELVNMVIEAITEAILVRIYDALIGIWSKLPAVNKATMASFDKADFDAVLNVVKAYGSPVIMGTPLALAQIPLDASASEADKLDMRNLGRIGVYKGCPVVEMPNSFEDTENTIKTFSDKYIFIIPAGSEKVVKVALEGGIVTRETNREDWTTEFDAYQKVGVAVHAVNNIGMIEITDLA